MHRRICSLFVLLQILQLVILTTLVDGSVLVLVAHASVRVALNALIWVDRALQTDTIGASWRSATPIDERPLIQHTPMKVDLQTDSRTSKTLGAIESL